MVNGHENSACRKPPRLREYHAQEWTRAVRAGWRRCVGMGKITQPWRSETRMRLDATKVQLEDEVTRTPEDIRLRYRENRDWRLFPKEWIYKNIVLKGKDVLDFGCGTGEI